MKIQQFQPRGNNSVCARAFRVLRGHTPAQLRGNTDCNILFISFVRSRRYLHFHLVFKTLVLKHLKRISFLLKHVFKRIIQGDV
jgi:hypothetical protein